MRDMRRGLLGAVLLQGAHGRPQAQHGHAWAPVDRSLPGGVQLCSDVPSLFTQLRWMNVVGASGPTGRGRGKQRKPSISVQNIIWGEVPFKWKARCEDLEFLLVNWILKDESTKAGLSIKPVVVLNARSNSLERSVRLCLLCFLFLFRDSVQCACVDRRVSIESGHVIQRATADDQGGEWIQATILRLPSLSGSTALLASSCLQGATKL